MQATLVSQNLSPLQAGIDYWPTHEKFRLQFLSDHRVNPFTPELKNCILPTFQKAIVWVM